MSGEEGLFYPPTPGSPFNAPRLLTAQWTTKNVEKIQKFRVSGFVSENGFNLLRVSCLEIISIFFWFRVLCRKMVSIFSGFGFRV